MVEQHDTSLHLQWIDGQSEWLDDIVDRSEYRIVASPTTESILGKSPAILLWCSAAAVCESNCVCGRRTELAMAQMITSIEELDEEEQEQEKKTQAVVGELLSSLDACRVSFFEPVAVAQSLWLLCRACASAADHDHRGARTTKICNVSI